MLLFTGFAQAEQSAPPAGLPRPTLVVRGLSIASDGRSLVAKRGSQVVWRTPVVFAFRLTSGPGRLFTAEGFLLGPQTLPAGTRSLLILGM